LQESFNTLIDSFIEDKVGITGGFLEDSLALGLKTNLLALYADEKMQDARTGNNSLPGTGKSIRSDKIHWLDRCHQDVHENDFFDILDQFILHLNETCYSGITGYEFHYTLYEKGSSYKKHLDQFRNNDSRKYSMIIYLNENWQAGDGGELCIHHGDYLQHITPENGKTVFFKSSDLEHEVLVSNKARMSITGWLKAGI
jgi:SM-20-related protein